MVKGRWRWVSVTYLAPGGVLRYPPQLYDTLCLSFGESKHLALVWPAQAFVKTLYLIILRLPENSEEIATNLQDSFCSLSSPYYT